MKEIPDYPGYKITPCGKVFNSDGVRRPEYMSGIPAYKYVSLPDKNNSTGWQIKRVHILVAKTYIPNPDNLPMVNHIDENKLNCHVDNLEWCTRSYNTLHSRGSRVKVYKPSVKYTEEEAAAFVAQFRLRGGSKRKAYMPLSISPTRFNAWLERY